MLPNLWSEHSGNPSSSACIPGAHSVLTHALNKLPNPHVNRYYIQRMTISIEILSTLVYESLIVEQIYWGSGISDFTLTNTYTPIAPHLYIHLDIFELMIIFKINVGYETPELPNKLFDSTRLTLYLNIKRVFNVLPIFFFNIILI